MDIVTQAESVLEIAKKKRDKWNLYISESELMISLSKARTEYDKRYLQGQLKKIKKKKEKLKKQSKEMGKKYPSSDSCADDNDFSDTSSSSDSQEFKQSKRPRRGGKKKMKRRKKNEEEEEEEEEAVPPWDISQPTVEDTCGIIGHQNAITFLMASIKGPMEFPDHQSKFLKSAKLSSFILYGPPGNGKTESAAYIAAQTGCSLLKVSAACLMDKYVGGTSRQIRKLFQEAKTIGKVIIFIDEIDSMAVDRNSTASSGERQALFQILIEMNKLKEPSFKNVFVICATNDPSALDGAILRRFSFVYIGMPTHQDRIDLFKLYLNNHHTLTDDNFQYLATQTNGFSCSDIERIVSTCITFFYQELYNNMRRQQNVTENTKDFAKTKKIEFSDVKHVVVNSSSSIDPFQLRENLDFKQNHKNISNPKNELSSMNNAKKQSIVKKMSTWLFGS